MTGPIECYPGYERDLRRGYTQEMLDDANAMRRTAPITYRRSPWWKVALSRILLALAKAITRTETGWRWLCKRLDAHPLVVLFLLVASGYVGVLLVQVARHMATGSW